MYEKGKSNTDFIGYEYTEINVSQKSESFYTDGYSNFGWELEKTSRNVHPNTVTLKFRRNRKIKNKAELTRLQRKFDSVISEIEDLERSKILVASTVAYVVGVIGTAFMAGSVFAVTGGLTAASIVLAVPAFVGWVLPYWLYRNIKKRKTTEVTPVIDEKYDEVYTVSRDAHELLGV